MTKPLLILFLMSLHDVALSFSFLRLSKTNRILSSYNICTIQDKSRTSFSSDNVAERDRRLFLDHVLISCVCFNTSSILSPKGVHAKYIESRSRKFSISDLLAMTYERKLGNGTYKQVYSILVTNSQKIETNAMAVEKLQTKSDARDEIRGIKLVQEIQSVLNASQDAKYFESVEDWWIQTLPPNKFEAQKLVFSADSISSIQRNEKIPTSFIGKNWYLVSYKPLYDMDLKKFCKTCSLKYWIGDEVKSAGDNSMDKLCAIELNEQSAFRIFHDAIHAGKILHEQLGIVHRDIKPKNIMLRDGHIVLIDFGFARKGDLVDGKLCIVESGILRGEVKYVIAEDVARYRGCTNGDTFAMGRTLFELFFVDFNDNDMNSDRMTITSANSKRENDEFRKILLGPSPELSRFQMSLQARDKILYIIRGLCDAQEPTSFHNAETLLHERMDGTKVGMTRKKETQSLAN
uniref:Protein kinase domain-containing protein n=1 Tax=Corethron hystrix TaxID=216773 RepID=A0A7S1BNX3_9STRA|mmetsp:Transcript_33865/g.78202  ORF Transcript_33865/g.78202 Transcript_33865/m.78202 type:complete len:462 (+) Transcript_33865:31-1416(+)